MSYDPVKLEIKVHPQLIIFTYSLCYTEVTIYFFKKIICSQYIIGKSLFLSGGIFLQRKLTREVQDDIYI